MLLLPGEPKASLAREFQPKGIHVGHVVIDGGINGEKIRTNVPELAERVGEDGLIGLDGIAEAYMYLYNQPKSAWHRGPWHRG